VNDELRGGFPVEIANRRHNRKVNQALCAAIEAIIPKSAFVVDMGSSAYGQHVRWMRENGWGDAHGIDASPDAHKSSGGTVTVGNLTTPNICQSLFQRLPDWIVFSEVGEHVPGRFEKELFDNLAAAQRGVLISWATAGRDGHEHVNCRIPEWVACEMGRVGFQLNEQATLAIREGTSRFLRRRIMVFTKKGIE